jgi:O-antigen ligase
LISAVTAWIDRVGVFGLMLFALASVWLTAPGNIGLALCLPSAILAAWRARKKHADIVTLLAFIIVVWLLLRYILQVEFGVGEEALQKPQKAITAWLSVPLFVLLAAMPNTDPLQRLRMLWLLAMMGFTFGVLGFLGKEGVEVLWSGERLGFHLKRPLGIGLYAGSFAIMLIATHRLWWSISGVWHWPTRLVAFSLILLFTQVVIASQNRSTMLGVLVVLAFATLAQVFKIYKGRSGLFSKRDVLVAAVTGIAVAGLIVINGKTISDRLMAERPVLATVASSGLSDAPASSVTIRLRLWQLVLERFTDAPFIGHGFGHPMEVIQRDLLTRIPIDLENANIVQNYNVDHFHNSYLQILWTQGLVGVCLWGALVMLLVRDAIRAARNNVVRKAIMPAMWGVLIFTAVLALTDYPLSHPHMRFFTILLLLSLRLLGQGSSVGRDS